MIAYETLLAHATDLEKRLVETIARAGMAESEAKTAWASNVKAEAQLHDTLAREQGLLRANAELQKQVLRFQSAVHVAEEAHANVWKMLVKTQGQLHDAIARAEAVEAKLKNLEEPAHAPCKTCGFTAWAKTIGHAIIECQVCMARKSRDEAVARAVARADSAEARVKELDSGNRAETWEARKAYDAQSMKNSIAYAGMLMNEAAMRKIIEKAENDLWTLRHQAAEQELANARDAARPSRQFAIIADTERELVGSPLWTFKVNEVVGVGPTPEAAAMDFDRKWVGEADHLRDIADKVEPMTAIPSPVKYECGVSLIDKERQRQIDKWGLADDEQYAEGELAEVAAYLAHEAGRGWLMMEGELPPDWVSALAMKLAPDRVRELAVAGAFCAAEIDRLNRVKARFKAVQSPAAPQDWRGKCSIGRSDPFGYHICYPVGGFRMYLRKDGAWYEQCTIDGFFITKAVAEAALASAPPPPGVEEKPYTDFEDHLVKNADKVPDIKDINKRSRPASSPAEPVKPEVPGWRDELGQVVRNAWVRWASRQPSPKSSWLVPWHGLNETDKEADRCIADELVAYMRMPGLPFRIVEEKPSHTVPVKPEVPGWMKDVSVFQIRDNWFVRFISETAGVIHYLHREKLVWHPYLSISASCVPYSFPDEQSARDALAKAPAPPGWEEPQATVIDPKAEVEQLRAQLLACLRAAEGMAIKPMSNGDYEWSPAYPKILTLRHRADQLADASARDARKQAVTA